MPASTEEKTPPAAADLDRLLRRLKDVPARALAAWFRPVLAHLAPSLQGTPLPDRVADLARLAGVPIAPPAGRRTYRTAAAGAASPAPPASTKET